MSIFQDISLPWAGGEKVIPKDRVLGAIAIVEARVTLGDLAEMADARRLRYAQLTYAYADLLRYAGEKVTDEQVYDRFFGNASQGMVSAALDLVFKLHQLMIPPAHLLEAEQKLAAKKDAEANAGKTAADEATASSPSVSSPSSAAST